jgi:hypothetical protein
MLIDKEMKSLSEKQHQCKAFHSLLPEKLRHVLIHIFKNNKRVNNQKKCFCYEENKKIRC